MRVILAIAALIAVTASACGGTDEVVTPATTPDLFGNSAAITTVAPLKVDGWVPVDLPDLRAANDECVRDAQPESVQIVEEGPETVTVESGDTLGKIAERFDTTVAAFMRANSLSDPTGCGGAGAD